MPGDNIIFEPVQKSSTYPRVTERIRSDKSLGWLRRLQPIVMTHRWRIACSVLAAVVAMVAQILVPRVVGLAVDRSLIDETSGLTGFVLVLLVLGALRATATFAYRYGLYGMAFKVEYQLRNMLFEHLGQLSFSFFDRVQSGQIISRANSDIRSVQMFMAFAPIMAVQFLSFIIAIGLMAAISIPLTAITMVALPGVFAIGQRLRKVMFPLSWVIQSRQAEIATVVDESVNGVRVVKAFASEQQQIETLAKGAQRLRWANMVQHRTRASHTPLIENLPRIALAVVLLVGGLQTIDGALSVGDLISFNLYILLLQAPFRFIGMLLILGQRAKASAERIFEILDEPPAVEDRPGAIDLFDAHGAVSFKDVRFAYGTETVGGNPGNEEAPVVLNGFSLDIPAGQTVAIVGKTGYDTVVGERGYDLSGGQRQRISLARLFLQSPSVILLDDSTSAIDVEIEQSIHQALKSLLQDRTTIVIAHRLSTIALADRVVLIDKGKVIADGTHRQLLLNEPRYIETLEASTETGEPWS